ncbi:hypothetical protein PCANC_24872 [Puccinia coronata f. sp. avenae]|uniref:Uncharacterized protein n=1 Tax=Puccinia coronata f. sp. avenae TaxID=200324 RepID=A0A2N5S1T5_9BASI|nr:hypothetical protein PCANC_24872 [Puccinia coronata f. sp. avenae]
MARIKRRNFCLLARVLNHELRHNVSCHASEIVHSQLASSFIWLISLNQSSGFPAKECIKHRETLQPHLSMAFGRLGHFLRITIALSFLSYGRVARAPHLESDETSCIDQASSVLRQSPFDHDESPLKRGRHNALGISRPVVSSDKPPDAGRTRILCQKYDGVQLNLPGIRNRPLIKHCPSNLVGIDSPTFQLDITGFIQNADIPRERIASWKKIFTDFIRTTWPTPKKNLIGSPWLMLPNWPAATVPLTDGSSIVTEFIFPLNGQGQIYEKSNLVKEISDLHTWLLYAHKIVVQVLNPNHESNHLIHFHEDLIRWLFDELFNPKHGLPVFGPKKLTHGASSTEPFSNLQSRIFKLLQQKESVSMTSVAIVGSWYKRNDVGWQHLFKSDQEFWEAVVQSMIEEANVPTSDESAIHLTLTLKDHLARSSRPGSSATVVSSLRIPDDKIGNFQFARPDKLHVKNLEKKEELKWLNDVIHRTIPKLTEPQHSTEILENSLDNFDNVNFAREKVSYRFPNVNIVIKAEGEKAEIRILSKEQIMIRPSRIKKQIKRLIYYLETVPQATFSLLDNQFGHGVHESGYWSKLHEEFVKWFGMKLFGQDLILFGTNLQSKFPIVGQVATCQVQFRHDPPYDDVQLFIIKFISHGTKGCRSMDAIMVIFGYWLKNECKEVWKVYFEEDEVFSHFVLKVFERGSGKLTGPKFQYRLPPS